jgi:serine/threonine protein phosphatase PrpC
MLKAFKAKAMGAAHKEKGRPCQDAVGQVVSSDKTLGLVFAADGHGGEKYFRSEEGSQQAVRIASSAFRKFLNEMAKTQSLFFDKKETEIVIRDKQIDRALENLGTKIVLQWKGDVVKHFAANPLDEKEKELCDKYHIDTQSVDDVATLYGTTLLGALVYETFWFALQIGDGLCVVIREDETPITPIPEDERLGFGMTTSL